MKKIIVMTQLIVTIEDANLLPDLKRAIKMLRGVKNITVRKSSGLPNKTTEKAMIELEAGQTIKCVDFEDYLKKVQ